MPKMVDTMETMVGARIFSTMDFEVGLLASEDGRRVSALYSFYGREFGGVRISTNAVRVV